MSIGLPVRWCMKIDFMIFYNHNSMWNTVICTINTCIILIRLSVSCSSTLYMVSITVSLVWNQRSVKREIRFIKHFFLMNKYRKICISLSGCVDRYSGCSGYRRRSRCNSRSTNYMATQYCRKTCNICA